MVDDIAHDPHAQVLVNFGRLGHSLTYSPKGWADGLIDLGEPVAVLGLVERRYVGLGDRRATDVEVPERFTWPWGV